MIINEFSYLIRGAIFSVHNELGPGLFESVYEAALSYELKDRGLIVQNQTIIPAFYKGFSFDLGFRADIIVNDNIIIEVKSIEKLQNIHKKQLITYLKLSGMRLGILVNFNVDKLVDKESLVRLIN